MNESPTPNVAASAGVRDDGHGIALGRPTRPTNFVAGALPDRGSYERVVDALVEEGIDRDRVAVLHGEVGAAAIAEGRQRGQSWFDLGDEERYVERFERAAGAGAWVIGVELPDGRRETRARVRSILLDNGGYAIVSRSRWTHDVET